MKPCKFIVSALLTVSGCAALYALNPKDVTDTSTIRISSPAMRAEMLTTLMKRKLDLDAGTTDKLQQINLKAEEELQKLVLDEQAMSGVTRKTSRGPDKFDNFYHARVDAYKTILGNSKFRLFESSQYALRNDLKKMIFAQHDNLKKQDAARQKDEEAAERERQAAELAAKQRAYQESKAAKVTASDDGTQKDKSKKKKKKKKKK